MRLKKYSPVPKRYKFLQIVNEAEATSLARQNMPRFKVKDNFFSGGYWGVRGYGSIGSRIEAIYRIYRISHTARITFFGRDRKVGKRTFRARTGKQL
ncbi:hypothetical protein HpMS197_12360 [Helicobacter pylori]